MEHYPDSIQSEPMSSEVDPHTIRDSVFLHQLCCDVGFSKQQWQRRIICADILNTFHSYLSWFIERFRSKILLSGSSAEGVAARFLGSDTDVMLVFDGTKIIVNGHVSQDESDHTYQIVRIHHPAFVRLMLLSTGSNQNRRISNTPAYCEVDEDGRLVLNGRRIVENEGGVRHGPAATRIFGGTDEHDRVVSLHCKDWPSASEEWIHRHRPFHWPSPDLINVITAQGCELVAVGRPTSPAPHLEWRLSSSLAERTLIRSLNIVQIQCYFLLKLTNVFLIKPEVPNSLASYHMKIVILHVIENTDPREWTTKRLTLCFMKCLKLLLLCLEIGYCPQVFISQHNLFERKVEGLTRRKLVDIVRGLTQEGWRCLLRCLPFCKEQYLCQHRELRCPCYIRYWKLEVQQDQYKDLISGLCLFPHQVYTFLHKNASSSLINIIELLLSVIKDRVTDDPQHFPSVQYSICVRRVVSCHLGYILLSSTRSKLAHNVRHLAPVLHYAKQLLVSNCDLDVTSCRLKLGTFHYESGEKERCVQTVTDVLHRYTADVVPLCSDTERSAPFLEIQRYREYLNPLIPLFGDLETLMKKCAYPVVFFRYELSCTTKAVQGLVQIRPLRTEFDRKYDSLIFIDPLVYAYYLLVIAEHDLGRDQRCRRAMERLRHIVNNPRVYYLFYPEVANFLLGYCERYVSN